MGRWNNPAAILRLEALLWDQGCCRVAGIDEVGLGPLAGPVVACAVVFPAGVGEPLGVADSKTLSPTRRQELSRQIHGAAEDLGLGVVEVEEIDAMGVREAGLEAMRRAVGLLIREPDYALVDAHEVPGLPCPQTGFVKADAFVYSVAAASIVAKVYRDEIMQQLEIQHPGYGLGRHMGYGTAAHMAALRELGPSPVHRRSFAPVRALLGG